MSGTEHIDLFVFERAIERVHEYVQDRYDVGTSESGYYVRIVIENAIEEWCDEDPNAEIEDLIHNAMDALGGDDNEEKDPLFSNLSVASDEKTRLARDVRESIEALFNKDYAERAPETDTKGEYLSRILLEFVTDGRRDRLRRKVKRIDLFARCESGNASSVEQKVARIRSELSDKFDNGYPVKRDDLVAAVKMQPQTKTQKTREKLIQRVLDHDTVEYVESPTTKDVFMPREQAIQRMENLGLPGILDGPKYDRLQAGYEFADLSKDDKIEGIKVALVRLAMHADLGGTYRLTAEQIRRRVFGIAESVRVDTIRRYMNEIADEDGFTETQTEENSTKAVQVHVPTIIKTDVDLLEKANLAKEYDYEDAPDTGLVVNITSLFDAESESISDEPYPSEQSDDRQSTVREVDARFDELVEGVSRLGLNRTSRESSTDLSTSSTRLSKPVSSLTTADELERHPYRDPEKLRTVYEQEGTITGTAAHFDVTETTARLWLIHHGIYDPERQGLSSVANQLEELSPEDLGLAPLGEYP
ncbi:hypothetical protein BG842_02410 [Haladaptatus sp. W1]|uniref:hypothetical protein n=1 Tax=Haladaptatus sp. W1 TaxID=1897478 RepID=UPI0008498A06|nr:hypothetical protein [Haladaptatus sp. W1]ODR80842.1 hypothetical protein BG842_02410 [Haladaptatus sp. W1]